MRDLTPVVAVAALDMNASAVVQDMGYMMMRRGAGPDIQRTGGNAVVRAHDVTMGMAVRMTPVVGVSMTMRNTVAVMDMVRLETPTPTVVVPTIGHRVRRCDGRKGQSEQSSRAGYYVLEHQFTPKRNKEVLVYSSISIAVNTRSTCFPHLKWRNRLFIYEMTGHSMVWCDFL